MITKEEFELLHGISLGTKSHPDRISGDEGLLFYEALFETLEKKALIKIERRKDKIYGAVETAKGAAILSDPQYAEWIID